MSAILINICLSLASVNISHFQFLLNGCIDLLQTWNKCYLWGTDQVLLHLKWMQDPIWLPWLIIGWHNFDFRRTAAEIYSKLGQNIPYGVLTKCWYFLCGSEFRYGIPCLWFADTFSTSQEWLQGSTVNLAHVFLMWSRPNVTFYVDPKSKIATLDTFLYILLSFSLGFTNTIKARCMKLYMDNSYGTTYIPYSLKDPGILSVPHREKM